MGVQGVARTLVAEIDQCVVAIDGMRLQDNMLRQSASILNAPAAVVDQAWFAAETDAAIRQALHYNWNKGCRVYVVVGSFGSASCLARLRTHLAGRVDDVMVCSMQKRPVSDLQVVSTEPQYSPGQLSAFINQYESVGYEGLPAHLVQLHSQVQGILEAAQPWVHQAGMLDLSAIPDTQAEVRACGTGLRKQAPQSRPASCTPPVTPTSSECSAR